MINLDLRAPLASSVDLDAMMLALDDLSPLRFKYNGGMDGDPYDYMSIIFTDNVRIDIYPDGRVELNDDYVTPVILDILNRIAKEGSPS